MLQSLGWESLQQRRACSRVMMLYRIRNGLVDIPATTFLKPVPVCTRGHETRYMQMRYSSSMYGQTVWGSGVEFSAHWDLSTVAWQFQDPAVRHVTCVTRHPVFILHLCTVFTLSPCFRSTCYHLNGATLLANIIPVPSPGGTILLNFELGPLRTERTAVPAPNPCMCMAWMIFTVRMRDVQSSVSGYSPYAYTVSTRVAVHCFALLTEGNL